jgi:hypothetical protein
VIKQSGGISGGIASPIKFSTGVQFAISDPAVMQVGAALPLPLRLLQLSVAAVCSQ